MKFLIVLLPLRTFSSSKTPQVSACPLNQIKLALLWNFDTADSGGGGGEVFFRFQVFVLLSFCFVQSTQSRQTDFPGLPRSLAASYLCACYG